MATPLLPDSVPSFRDALGLAFELGDNYPGRTHAITTDAQGRVQSVVKTDGVPFLIVPELNQARPAPVHGGGCLVLSSYPEGIGPIDQTDIVTFSLLSNAAHYIGRKLLDWIVVDEDDARSFCYLFRAEQAWECDPAEVRAADYLMMLQP